MVTFDDTGLSTTAQTPLPIGSLGKWNAVSSLTTPRYGAAAAIAHGKATATTDTWFLYVAGGAGDTALTQASCATPTSGRRSTLRSPTARSR